MTIYLIESYDCFHFNNFFLYSFFLHFNIFLNLTFLNFNNIFFLIRSRRHIINITNVLIQMYIEQYITVNQVNLLSLMVEKTH